MSAVSIQAVTFTYLDAKRPALRDFTLSIPDGQICGIIGRGGAGKSTLCALCAGFIPQFYDGQFTGSVMVDGQDVLKQTVSELVRHIGLVSSNPFSQISGARFTVYEEVALALENLGYPREEIKERVDWALATLGITHLADRSPFALSGGQQQRMVIAGTFALRPPVLVLDEPTTQLDPPSVAELAETLRELARQGTTIVFAEHRLEWTAALADRVVALDEGQIIADGTPAEIMSQPQMIERGIGWPRSVTIAQRLRSAGKLPHNTPIPVTEQGLLTVLNGKQPTTDDRRPATNQQVLPDSGQPATSSGQRATGNTPIIQLENVRFAYPSGVEALRGVSLTIGSGERIAILGRNGAGKSTLVRHLNGLLKPSVGQVLVNGMTTNTTTVAQNARQVGIVFQDIRNQLFARSVRDEVRFGPRNLRFDAQQVDRLTNSALNALGLTDVADEHPYDLPLAQRRLVAIAAVLAMDTPVLVLDEPTAGLDGAGVTLLLQLTQELAAQGKTVVVVSHDLDFCYEALERVVLVREGHVPLDATWSTLAPAQIRLLEETVDLPLGLQVKQHIPGG